MTLGIGKPRKCDFIRDYRAEAGALEEAGQIISSPGVCFLWKCTIGPIFIILRVTDSILYRGGDLRSFVP